jgi:hypothetical protein
MSWLVLRAARLARLNEPVEIKTDWRARFDRGTHETIGTALCPALAGQGVARELVVTNTEDALRASKHLTTVWKTGVKFACVRVLGIAFWDDETFYQQFEDEEEVYEREDEVYEREWTTMLDVIVEKVLLPGGILEVDVSNKKDISLGLIGEGLWNFVRTKYPGLELRLNYRNTSDSSDRKLHDKMTTADEVAITRQFVAQTTERSRPTAAKAIQRVWRLRSGNPYSALGSRVLARRFEAYVSEM